MNTSDWRRAADERRRDSGAWEHQAVVTHPRVLGGAAVACRCGWGRWFATEAEAEMMCDAHELTGARS